MTLNLCCNRSEDCCEETACIPGHVLSEQATREILNDQLSALVAIGKDCKPVLFMPYGTQQASNCENLLEDDNAMTLLDITIRIPKHTTITAKKFCVCYPPGGKPPYGCWK
jgi:hypothetical protein